VGVFTNLTQDHLDFHKTMEAYRDAKALLFREHAQDGVVLVDGEYGAWMAEQVRGRRITVSARDGGADVHVPRVVYSIAGIEADVVTPQGPMRLTSPLIGGFNLENLVGAVGVGLALGLSNEAIARALAQVRGVPGRLERVDAPPGIGVFVDYAHTP